MPKKAATQGSRKRPREDFEYSSPLPAEGAGGPYASFGRPSEEDIRAVHRALCLLHPEFSERKRAEATAKTEREGGCGERKLVLDALVGTILSQNTTDVNSHRAFASLKQAFPTWAEVLKAPSAQVEEAIRSGGLAAIKTARVKVILQTLLDETGELSLEHLRLQSDDEVKAALVRARGGGKDRRGTPRDACNARAAQRTTAPCPPAPHECLLRITVV